MPTDEPTDPLARFEAAVRTRVGADADAWLEGLPDLISAMTANWNLTITGPAREVDAFGMTIPATRADATGCCCGWPIPTAGSQMKPQL